jgi:hypothetical protein
VHCGLSKCLGVKKALALSDYSTVCQALLAWISLPQVRPSGVFFVVKEVGSGG